MTEPKQVKLSNTRFRGVIYGDMGVGKTTLAMTFPRPLVIDLDDGLISVTYAAGGDIEARSWEPDGHRAVEEIILWLRQHQEEYDTIVLDEITTLEQLFLRELTKEHAKAKPSPDNNRPLLMALIPEQAEYLAWLQQCKNLLFYFKQLKKHVVILAGLRIDEKNNAKHVLDLAPSVQRTVGKWGHVVGELISGVELEDGKEHRILATEPKPGRQAKSRFADLRPVVIDPTFDNLWQPIADKLPDPE